MNLTAPRRLSTVATLDLPFGYDLEALHVAEGSHEVLHVSCGTTPTLTDGRQIHKSRDARRNVVLVVAIESPRGVHLVGPNAEGAMAGPLPVDQAQRILQAGLDETTALAARRRLTHLLAAVETNDDLAGVTNAGLFATHYLATSARERDDWADRTEAARPMLDMRSSDLVAALGYTSEGLGAGALLLSTTEGPVHAVAVLMTEREGFDAATDRFGASPVQYGLAKAHQERVPWLIVLRGAQIRLYPVRPDAGVGRRSQAETYLELDLSVVDDRTAGFLPLVFAAGALEDDGTVQELLDGSVRYAAALGERLRDRVYTHVVPNLAVAVATDLERLGHGDDLDAAYRITLKVLFRLLFQAYAEDQGLLPYHRNDRYTRNSLTTQANDFVERPDRELDADSHAIWSDLRQVWDVIDTGNKDWDVPAYNGGLFGQDPDLHPDGYLIDQMRLDDHSVGTALRYLLTDDTGDGELGAVDFRSLSVREFGTIYEGLLESSLSRAETDLALDKNNAYIPTDDPDKTVVHTGAIYHHNASGERKATGSYFTKPFAVEHLLERALDPTLTEHLDQVQALLDDDKPADAAEKFFDFRVADLAMGSGHFLIAAIDRMEVQMAAFLTDHPIPAISQELDRLEAAARTALGDSAGDYEIEPSALLRRQIARRCIYGLDINEIAVELARVAVWIHTFVPGLPMSSLDHTLVCGNSLTGIGTIDEAIEALEPKRKKGMPSLFAAEIGAALEEARAHLVDVANLGEATKAEVRQVTEAAKTAREAAAPTRRLFDAAVAVASGVAVSPASGSSDELRALCDDEQIGKELAALAPAHMPFLFPEVFLRPRAGFDVLVGNPPWDKVRHEPTQFWVVRSPGLNQLPSEKRSKEIEVLRKARPVEARQEDEERRLRSRIQHIAGKRYRLQGGGHHDFAKMFTERNVALRREGGALGLLLPFPLCVLAGWSNLRAALFDRSQSYVVECRNTNSWLFDIHGQVTVALVVSRKVPGNPTLAVVPGVTSLDLFIERTATGVVDLELIRLRVMVPDLEVPWFNSSEEIGLFEFIASAPTLGSGATWITGQADTRWDFSASGKNAEQVAGSPSDGAWSVLMARHILQYGMSDDPPRRYVPEPLSLNVGSRSGLIEVRDDVPLLSMAHPTVVYRFPSRSSDSRTLIASVLAPGWLYSTGYIHGVAFEGEPTLDDRLAVLAVINSVITDWWARRLVDRHVGSRILTALPLPDWDPEDRSVVAGHVSALLRGAGIEFLATGETITDVEPAAGFSRIEHLAEIDAMVASGLQLGTSPGGLRTSLEAVFADFTDKTAGVTTEYRQAIRDASEQRS